MSWSKALIKVAYDLYFVSAAVERLGRGHLDTVKAAIAGGATMVQLRLKKASKEEVKELARKALAISKEAGVPFIINDMVDVAIEVEADGVHVGQTDASVQDVRKALGPGAQIGVSVSTVDEALVAEEGGADYLGVGPVFRTGSKLDAIPPIGLERLSAIRQAVSIPLIGIGGITQATAGEVIRAGADGVAVVSAIAEADDMKRAAAELKLEVVLALKGRE